jgi:hypothetical protein
MLTSLAVGSLIQHFLTRLVLLTNHKKSGIVCACGLGDHVKLVVKMIVFNPQMYNETFLFPSN